MPACSRLRDALRCVSKGHNRLAAPQSSETSRLSLGEHLQRPPGFSSSPQPGDHFTCRLDILMNNEPAWPRQRETVEKKDVWTLGTLVVSSSVSETDHLNVSASSKKTSETLSTAGQKTSAAFSTLGSTISRKFEDMRYRLMTSSVQVGTPISSFIPSFVSLSVCWFFLGGSEIM